MRRSLEVLGEGCCPFLGWLFPNYYFLKVGEELLTKQSLMVPEDERRKVFRREVRREVQMEVQMEVQKELQKEFQRGLQKL